MNESRLEALELNRQAEMLKETGNVEAAKKKLDQAIETDPMVMDSYRNYGDLYMDLEDYEAAKNSYKKALLVEKDGLLYFLCGNACFMNDEEQKGLEYYNMAISAGYDNDEMMFLMGMAYEHLNDDQMAYRYFQKACVKNPSRPDYAVKKIHVMLRLNFIEEAEKAVDELLLTSPELYDGYHLKTNILLYQGAAQEAVEFSKKSVERFPGDGELMQDYVKCLAMDKQLDAALEIIRQSKKMSYYEDAKADFILLEAEVAAEANKYDDAMECCKECIALEGSEDFFGEARFMLMNLYLEKPDYESALGEAMKIVCAKKGDSYYHAALYFRAFCNKMLGNKEDAEKYYKEAIILYRTAALQTPEAIDVYLYRVMCLKDMEEYDKALEILDFVQGLNIEIAEAHMLRGEIYKMQGIKGRSQEELQKAYRLKPELEPKEERVGK